MISITDPLDGTVQELPTETPADVRKAYEAAKSLEDTAKRLRAHLKPHCKRIVEEHGDGKAFNYDDGYTLVHVSDQKFGVDPVKAYSEIGDIDLFMELVSITKGTYEEKIKEWIKEGKFTGDAKSAIVAKKQANDHYTLRRDK